MDICFSFPWSNCNWTCSTGQEVGGQGNRLLKWRSWSNIRLKSWFQVLKTLGSHSRDVNTRMRYLTTQTQAMFDVVGAKREEMQDAYKRMSSHFNTRTHTHTQLLIFWKKKTIFAGQQQPKEYKANHYLFTEWIPQNKKIRSQKSCGGLNQTRVCEYRPLAVWVEICITEPH